MANHYTKPPLPVEKQLQLLESRGLIIPNREAANHYLNHISYYRLSGYSVFFEKLPEGKRDHQFKEGTTFNDIIALYDFDRHLRILVMDAIERIEVAIRTQICSKLAIVHNDSHWHLNGEHFHSPFNHQKFLEACMKEQEKSSEKFILHYTRNYQAPSLVPSWMAIELLSIGTWSVVYKHLRRRSDKKMISDTFGLSPVALESWLHALTYLRNICAHHARLWNRRFTISPQQVSGYKQYLTPNNNFAALAAIIHIFLKIISPKNTWSNRLYELFQNHQFVNYKIMGFKQGWQKDVFWK